MQHFSPRHRRGNYMMTMGAFLPILLGFAALSIDISYIQMSRLQSQHVSDAASHAAFVAYRSTPGDVDTREAAGRAAADFVIGRNRIGNDYGELTEPIEFGTWDFNSRTFTDGGAFVNAAEAKVGRTEGKDNPLELFFAPILGQWYGNDAAKYNEWDVAGWGVTSGRAREIMIVQDVSCSFSDDISKAKDANIAFLDYLQDLPFPGDRVGLSLFGGRSNYPIYSELRDVSAYYEIGGSETYTRFGSNVSKPKGTRQRFQALKHCSKLPGWARGNPRKEKKTECHTTQARGLIEAMDQFDSRGNRREFQAVILISDGLPNVGLSKSANNGEAMSELAINMLYGADENDVPFTAPWNFDIYMCDDEANQVDQDCADEAQSRDYTDTFKGGVNVWTVTFENGGGDFTWMQGLERGLGESYNTPDADELESIMVEIASSIPVVLTE